VKSYSVVKSLSLANPLDLCTISPSHIALCRNIHKEVTSLFGHLVVRVSWAVLPKVVGHCAAYYCLPNICLSARKKKSICLSRRENRPLNPIEVTRPSTGTGPLGWTVRRRLVVVARLPRRSFWLQRNKAQHHPVVR